MLMMQPAFKEGRRLGSLFTNQSYAHGRELMAIQNAANWHIPGIEDRWPEHSHRNNEDKKHGGKKSKRRGGRRDRHSNSKHRAEDRQVIAETIDEMPGEMDF